MKGTTLGVGLTYIQRDYTGYYQSQGFEFCNVPIVDSPRSLKSNKGMDLKEAVLEAFDRMRKPVLLHCSAGIDRTSPAAAYIISKRGIKAQISCHKNPTIFNEQIG